ncbi:hypothetical protein BCR44DRAFT_1426969, partial [Catenaria anguillulae PL171]
MKPPFFTTAMSRMPLNSSIAASSALWPTGTGNGARPPPPSKQAGIPLIHLLLASENPTRVLTRVLASPRFQLQLIPLALFFALGVAIHVHCHRLRTSLVDLEKRRKQLAWLARLLYTHFTLALLVYTTLQPGWLGLSLLVRAFLMGVHLVLKTLVDVVSGEVDERVLRDVANGHEDLDTVRHPAVPMGASGNRRVLRVSPSILLLVREHDDESLIIRFRRSLSSGTVLVNEPPAEILLVQRTGRVVSMDDLLAHHPGGSEPSTSTSSQLDLV